MEYIFSNAWSLWIILAIVCLIIELSSFDFYLTCVAVGALGGMVASWLGLPIWAQWLLWAVVAVASVCWLRPVLTKHLHKKGGKRKSNADALLGRRGVVTEAIAENGTGYVKIDGDEWRSLSADGQSIAKDTNVEVVSRESITLTVRPLQSTTLANVQSAESTN